MTTWVSRNQRQKHNLVLKKLLLAILIMIAVFLIGARFYPELIDIDGILDIVLKKGSIIDPDNVELIYSQIVADLGLGQVEIKREPLNFKGEKKDYPCFSLLWPRGLPYVWFILRLQNKCSFFENLVTDAIEIKKGGSLVSWLVVPVDGDTIAEFRLISSNTLARVSSLSFIFKDFVEFKQKEALDIIWLDIPFGFILRPDQVPGGKLAKALKSSKGQCILEIPADRESWEIIIKGHELSGRIKNRELNEENLLTILNIFPVLDAIYFQVDRDIDRKLIQLIIGAAERLRLTYIYQNNTSSYIDSLAYSKGLKFKRMVETIDCSRISGDEFRSKVYSRTNELTKLNKGLYYIKSKQENIEIIASLLPLFERLNIIIVPPLRNAESAEKL